MSLRAVQFMLETEERQVSGRLAVQLEGMALASAAKWDKQNEKNFKAFQQGLHKIARPSTGSRRGLSPTASRNDLIKLFTGLGIPQAK
jgi:hypothetical protein